MSEQFANYYYLMFNHKVNVLLDRFLSNKQGYNFIKRLLLSLFFIKTPHVNFLKLLYFIMENY